MSTKTVCGGESQDERRERQAGNYAHHALSSTPRTGTWMRASLALCLATWSLAAWTIASGVKLNFFCRSFSGALAPKLFMPPVTPLEPTYLCQPNVPAISTDTRAV